MKKIKYFLLLLCIAGCFAACKKADIGDVYDPLPQFKSDTTAIRAFIKANNIPAIKNEQYGVFYQVLAPGSGSLTYSSTTQVSIEYDGRLLDGRVFDASTAPTAKQALGSFIPGVQIGIPNIQKGGKVRVLIPSFYAYGNVELVTSSGFVIPKNSILDFTITLSDAIN